MVTESEILTKGFSVMAALICTLGGLPKDESGIIQILTAHLGGIQTAKKLCTDGIARLSVPAAGLEWCTDASVCYA